MNPVFLVPVLLLIAGISSTFFNVWHRGFDEAAALARGFAGTVALPALAWAAGAIAARASVVGAKRRLVRLALAVAALPAAVSILGPVSGLTGAGFAVSTVPGLRWLAPLPVNAASAMSLVGVAAGTLAGGYGGYAMALAHLTAIVVGGSRAAGAVLGMAAVFAAVAALAKRRAPGASLPWMVMAAAGVLLIAGAGAVWRGRGDFPIAVPAGFVALDADAPAFAAVAIQTKGGGTLRARTGGNDGPVESRESMAVKNHGIRACDDFVRVLLRPGHPVKTISGVGFTVNDDAGRRSARVRAIKAGETLFEGDFYGCRGVFGKVSRLELHFPPVEAESVEIEFFPPHRTDFFEVTGLTLLSPSPAGTVPPSPSAGRAFATTGPLPPPATGNEVRGGTTTPPSTHPGEVPVGVGTLDRWIGRFRGHIVRLAEADSSFAGPSAEGRFFGVGPGFANRYFAKYRHVFETEGMPIPRHAHNLFLQLWLELGWPGLAAAAAMAFWALQGGFLGAAFLIMNLLDFVILTKSCAALTLFALSFEVAAGRSEGRMNCLFPTV